MKAYIAETKLIKKGKHWWNSNEYETKYKEVEVLGEKTVYASSGAWVYVLVKDKSGKITQAMKDDVYILKT